MPGRRLSADWGDALWVESRPPEELDGAGDLAAILERSLDGMAPTQPEVEALFRARGDQVDAVAWVADLLRQRTNGDRVTYVVNRNINYTNLCYFRCGFCAFSKGPRSLNLRGEPYLMGVEEIVQRAREAWDRGATEVCLQGGIHPDFTGDFYSDVVESIKAELPEIHIHGFTPLEVWQGAETLGVPVRQFLTRLRDAGLGTLPGTAAEVLDDRVRHHLCPDKVRTAEWAEVMITAHELGLRATSTLMFGHIDGPASWAEHYEVLRAIQRRTGGFTEFVPLPFVHMGAPIFFARPVAARPDVGRGGPGSRRRPHRLRRPHPQHPGFVGEARAGRGSTAARRRVQRSRRHLDERDHYPLRRRRSRPGGHPLGLRGGDPRCRPSPRQAFHHIRDPGRGVGPADSIGCGAYGSPRGEVICG